MPAKFTSHEPHAARHRSHSMDALHGTLALHRMTALDGAGALQVGGLPLHPLIVHAIVILVPLTALAMILGTVWPAARRRLGVVTPLAALVLVILVPLTVAAGQSLEAAIGPRPGVLQHASLGGMLQPWVIAMLLTSAAQWAWYRWGVPTATPEHARRTSTITIAIGVFVVIAAVGAVVMVVLIGESGARAVWGGLSA